MIDVTKLEPGFHAGIPHDKYLAIDAIGSTQLDWMATSPRHYHWAKSQPREETDATRLGTALHVALLEPQLFEDQYVAEPDPWSISPEAASPRATKAYKLVVAKLREGGKIVLRSDALDAIEGMVRSIRSHDRALELLEACSERELTLLWQRGTHRCRGRLDLGGDRIVADLKATRDLRRFSPWILTDEGYWRQAGHYVDGARRLGRDVEAFFHLAVENTPPHDVGVFELDQGALELGVEDANRQLARLEQCERDQKWPGMYPDLQVGMLSSAATEMLVASSSEVA